MRNVHLRSCGCWWRGGRETSPAVQRPTKVAAIACSDQECVYFVPSHYLRAPPIGRPGHPYAVESATIAAGVVSLTGSPKLEPKKRTNYGIQFHPSSVGAPMTPISFRQSARGQPGRSPITVITVARLSTGQSRAGRAALSEQKVQVGNISPPQLFAGGFVDFLLGRGARHPSRTVTLRCLHRARGRRSARFSFRCRRPLTV